MAWVRKADIRSTVPGPKGDIGLPGVIAVANDTATAGYVNSAASATWDALRSLFTRRRTFDPRDYGVIGDGSTDDTAALQATLTAAGAKGVVEGGELICLITAPLVLGANTQIRGVGEKTFELRTTTDIAAITASGGEGQAIRNLLIRSTFAGARTTYDIDITNPTKTVIENVEVSLPNASNGGGGIRFKRDSALAGNAFMPDLTSVWIRNGHLVIDGVTDGHVVGGWLWGSSTGNARATVDMSNISNGWSFAGVDVIPTGGAGAGYRLEQTWGTKINGGYIDGSYPTNMTGHGILVVNCGQLYMAGTQIYAVGRSGIRMENSHGSTISAVGFEKGNKQGNFYPDIDLYGSNGNTFVATAHSMRVARTNPGGVYREDNASTHNAIDFAAINLDGGNNYATPYFVGNSATQGKNNRPASIWSRPSGVPQFIVPPACNGLTSAVVWPVANRAQFHRFQVTDGAVHRYANVRVEVGSGNIQTAVVRMDGLNYTRVMSSGVIACTTGMSAAFDMTSTYLAPGEYALVVWVDNTTAQLRVATDELLRVPRLAAEVSTLTTGIPASGAITAWNSARAVLGSSLSSVS